MALTFAQLELAVPAVMASVPSDAADEPIDHFNRVDWTGQDNNFGVGLPPEPGNTLPEGEFQDPLTAEDPLEDRHDDEKAAAEDRRERRHGRQEDLAPTCDQNVR